MKQVINKDIDLIAVDADEKATKEFKSMYYKMNAKPDSMTKIYTKEVIIEINDIIELNDRVVEKFKSHYYKDAGFLINVVASFKNRKSISFASWKEFVKHKWVESTDINSITLTWDFNLTLPSYQNPQRHTLTVKLSNGMRPEEMLNIIFSGNIEDLDEANMNRDFFPILARVDFIDQLLGDELLNLVLSWCDGLKYAQNNQNKSILFLQKHKKKISYMVNYTIIFLGFVLGIVYLDYTINKYNIETIAEITGQQLIEIINTIIIFSGTLILTNIFFGRMANNLFGQLKAYGENHLFDITKGDRNTQEKVKHKNSLKSHSILIKVVVTLLINIVCGIVSSYLFTKMMK